MFFQLMRVSPADKILDVGGLPGNWLELGYQGRVICVGLNPLYEGFESGKITYEVNDAKNLAFPDRSFDIVYSNSLLEHVGRKNQSEVAKEISRVGKRYWVQAPNRNFPIEPHYRALFFYQLPPRLRRLVARYWTPIVWKENYYLPQVDTIYPPSFQEMQALFPGATILREKLLGLTKSFIAVSK